MSDTNAAVEQVTLTINGQQVTTTRGTTVLNAAVEAGIDIPHLCYQKEVSIYGSCRLCLVEIKQGKWSKLVASCAYPVEEGLEVTTENERIAKHRKVILELLSPRWAHLSDELMERYGADRERFEGGRCFCINCGLCVRYCSEVVGANVLGFIGRGTERQVVTYPELAAKYCPDCDSGCLDVCPTGVISSEFCVVGLTPPGVKPVAYPVCIRDDDNLRRVAKMVGDRGE